MEQAIVGIGIFISSILFLGFWYLVDVIRNFTKSYEARNPIPGKEHWRGKK